MTRSHSFRTQKIGEIAEKEARVSRDFCIMCMGIIEEDLQM